MEGSELIRALNDGPLFVIAIVMVAATAGIVITVISSMRSVAITRQREQTKREIAAYVSEGTIDPEQAVAMINAGKSFDLNEAIKKTNFESWAGCGSMPRGAQAKPA